MAIYRGPGGSGDATTDSTTQALAATQAAANAAASATLAASFTPSQTGNSGKLLTTDGTNTSWKQVTGTGNVVLSSSPTLVTPNLGTPTSLTLTNATELPIVAGTSGTLSVARGGTGLSSLTANYIPYGNGTGAYNGSANLQYNGSALTIGGLTYGWGDAYTPFESKNGSFLGGINSTVILSNLYFTASGATLKTTGFGSYYIQSTSGNHQWINSATGSSGTIPTLTERMRLSAAGGLSIGSTTDAGAGNLLVSGSITSSALTASQAVFTDANDKLVSVATSGTGNVVLTDSPTLTGTLSAPILNTTGDVTVKAGSTTGAATITTPTTELVLSQTGDALGASILRLQNRTGMNGAMFDCSTAPNALADFAFKTSVSQRNIRYETRYGEHEFQIGSTTGPTLLINDTATKVAKTTASTSTTSGALQVSGGVGIAGRVNVGGLFSPQQAASAPTYIKGAIYFDTTLNKLRVGGATGWETITST